MTRKGWAAAASGIIALFVLVLGRQVFPHAHAQEPEPFIVVVTNASDSVAEGESECPSETLCTLRRAIELVNADASESEYTISFDTAVFPPSTPAAVAITVSLPPVTRANVTIDGSMAGIVIRGPGPLELINGLVLSGANTRLRGVSVEGFGSACIVSTGPGTVIGGDPALGQGVSTGNCWGVGISLLAADARLFGSQVGFAGEMIDAWHHVWCLEVKGANTLIGEVAGDPATFGNRFGNCQIAIGVLTDDEPPFGGVRIEGNIIGRAPDGSSTPLSQGITLRPASSATVVRNNTIANAGVSGIQVTSGTSVGLDSTGNTFVGNTFEGLDGPAIDLGGDGLRNENDAGDTDAGPNTGLNYPTILRATTARIQGNAGPWCTNCFVELYVAHHLPGRANTDDYGSVPLQGARVLADAGGNFTIEAPIIEPGSWVTAIATDDGGNTSEFGPAVYVGDGSVTCGDTQLPAGWSHVPYLGEQIILGTSFPPNRPGAVSEIYHYNEASGEYQRWFSGTTVGRTLDSLLPGEAYFFHAIEPVTLDGGFSLTLPYPVQVVPGWNDFVYIGSAGDVRDALMTIAGDYSEVYRAVGAGAARWQSWGTESTPEWARQFTTIEPCRVYQVFVTDMGIITPLQP